MNPSKLIFLILAVAALGLIAAGCGGGTSPGSTSSSAASGSGSPFAFARCMRAHGVKGFPDPVVKTSGGSTSVSQMVPASAGSSRAFKSAQKACAHLQDAGQGSGPRPGRPSNTVLLAFARCLRAHGITRFPDPGGQAGLSLTTISAAGVDVHSPGFFSAARGCVGVTHGAITVAQVRQLVYGSH